jgi:hypothetical protein
MTASPVARPARRRARSPKGLLLPALSDDLESRDPDYVREVLPLAWMVASFWFRAEVRA